MTLKILNSKIDKSVNFIEEQLVGFLESRFVRKTDDYFICYLSSQTGCNRGCAFCHLTTTGQTSFIDSTHNDFIGQTLQVFKHYKNEKTPAKYCHFNFMARGEPLSNKLLLNSADELLIKLGQLARDEGLSSKFNISTIIPENLKRSLPEIFKFVLPTIYYSLYSVREDFRKKWMPTAMPIEDALNLLKEYQDYSKKIIKIHYAFIRGENDSEEDLKLMCDMLNTKNLLCEFNLVRYNPASKEQGEESLEEVIKERIEYLKTRIKGKVQIIPRVGRDVFASCGLFVS